MTRITAAQRRYLTEIVAAGERKYNGRARRPLEALRAAGLVEYDFTLQPQLGGTHSELFTVRPTDAGREAVQS